MLFTTLSIKNVSGRCVLFVDIFWEVLCHLWLNCGHYGNQISRGSSAETIEFRTVWVRLAYRFAWETSLGALICGNSSTYEMTVTKYVNHTFVRVPIGFQLGGSSTAQGSAWTLDSYPNLLDKDHSHAKAAESGRHPIGGPRNRMVPPCLSLFTSWAREAQSDPPNSS